MFWYLRARGAKVGERHRMVLFVGLSTARVASIGYASGVRGCFCAVGATVKPGWRDRDANDNLALTIRYAPDKKVY
jgi:hypothetical protein